MNILVTKRPTDFVTLAEAKKHCRVDVDNTDEDAEITALIKAAIQHLDGPKGWLGRFIGVQEIEVSQIGFPRERGLRLPMGDVLAVENVKYVDEAGAEQTWSADEYGVTGDLIWLRPRQEWPQMFTRPAPVRITYYAGFGKLENGTWVNDVPDPIRIAVMFYVGALYRDREAAELPVVADTLASPFRVMSA